MTAHWSGWLQVTSTFDQNKDLPQIKSLPEFQLKKYKKIVDAIDKLKPKIEKAQKAVNELNREQGLLYKSLENMWIYRARKAKESGT